MNFKTLFVMAMGLALGTVSGHAQQRPCLGLAPPEPPAKFKTANDTCYAKFKPSQGADSSKEVHKVLKDGCFLGCVWEQVGVVSADGTVSASALAAHINSMYPEAARAGIIDKVNKNCVPTTALDTTDKKCKAHKTFTKCIFKRVNEVCNGGAAGSPTPIPSGSGPASTSPAPNGRRRRATGDGESSEDSDEEPV